MTYSKIALLAIGILCAVAARAEQARPLKVEFSATNTAANMTLDVCEPSADLWVPSAMPGIRFLSVRVGARIEPLKGSSSIWEERIVTFQFQLAQPGEWRHTKGFVAGRCDWIASMRLLSVDMCQSSDGTLLAGCAALISASFKPENGQPMPMPVLLNR